MFLSEDPLEVEETNFKQIFNPEKIYPKKVMQLREAAFFINGLIIKRGKGGGVKGRAIKDFLFKKKYIFYLR